MLSIPLYSKLDRSRPLIFLNANQMIKLLIIKALLHKAVLLISCLKNPLMEGCVNVIKHVLKYPPVEVAWIFLTPMERSKKICCYYLPAFQYLLQYIFNTTFLCVYNKHNNNKHNFINQHKHNFKVNFEHWTEWT